MPKRFTARAIAYTAIGTAASIVISASVTAIALRAAGLPVLPIAMMLSIGLPALVAPLTMLPLIAMTQRQRQLQVELERLVRTDTLTGLPNRRAFFEFARPALAHAVATGTPLTAMMIDVDHFKAINDSYGHDAGDMVLKRIAATVQNAVASVGADQCIVARIGGEEFAAIVGGLLPATVAQLAEQMCRDVRDAAHGAMDNRAATVSIGVALCSPSMSIDALIKVADDAAYSAKRGGRDRWAFASTVAQIPRTLARPMPKPANDRIAV